MFTNEQKQVIDGSLLGDATIWTKNKHNDFLHRIATRIINEGTTTVLKDVGVKEMFENSLKTSNKKFQKAQSKLDHRGDDKQTYMDWHMKMFGDFSSSVKPMSFKGVGGKTYHRYTFTTHMEEIWNEVDERWYKMELIERTVKRTKIVPRDVKLTPLTLCVWHMDDGSANPKDANIELNTQGFTVEEIDFLIERLDKDLGIKSHKKKARKKDQYKIYIGRDHYFDFMEMIKPHIEWDCFKYKVDTETYDKKPHQGETHSLSKLTEANIKQIFKLRDKGWLQKKIAKKFDISQANISVILSGDRWSHLGKKINVERKPRLTKETKSQIVLLKEDGVFQKAIAERLNINQSTVSRVLKENHCHVLN